MAFTYLTVTIGSGLRDPGGAQMPAKVRFTPTAPGGMRNGTTTVGKVECTVGADGTLTPAVAATDDAGTTPVGGAYLIEVIPRGAPVRSFYAALPAASPGGTVDLDSLAELGEAPTLSALAETTAGAAAKVAAHEADTTNVHGITNTAALETTTGATAKVAAHTAVTDPHGDRAYAAALVAAWDARGGVHVDNYAADPTGATDSTAAFQAALAALPTVTIRGVATVPGAPGAGGSGTAATARIGTIRLGVGTYRLDGDIGNLGPFVSIVGPGHNACTLDYRGTGDCLRAANTVRPFGDTFYHLNGMAGRFDGFTISGDNSGDPGATGLHLGDAEGFALGPDLYIRGFAGTLAAPTLTLGSTAGSGGTFTAGTYYWRITAAAGATTALESANSNQVSATLSANGTQALSWAAITGATAYKVYRADAAGAYVLVTTTAATSYTDTGTSVAPVGSWPIGSGGAAGLLFDNQYSWTENARGWATILNCQTAVVFHACGGSTVQNGFTGGDNSFMYNDLTFKIYGFEQQNGILLQNGATYQGGRLVVTANMKNNTAATTNALLTLTGQGPTGHLGASGYSRIQNTDLQVRAETNGSATNKVQTVKYGTAVSNTITGSYGILSFQSSWTASNWSLAASFAAGTLDFAGPINGDANLATANGYQASTAVLYPKTTMFSGGNFIAATGDILTYTLTGNITVAFGTSNKAAAQRKTLILKQDGTGSRTVTWPKPGSPSISAPAVYWAGGTAPTMTATAGATDVYHLVTYDGASWYASATQNVS